MNRMSGGAASFGGVGAGPGFFTGMEAPFSAQRMGSPAGGGVAVQNPFPGWVTPSGYQMISGTCSESTYLRLATGNLIRKISLVDVPTIGPDLSFTLFLDHQGGGLRHNWMMTFSALIHGPVSCEPPPAPCGPPPPNEFVFTSPTGRQHKWVTFNSIPSDSDLVLDSYRIGGPQGVSFDFDGSLCRIVFGPDGSFLEFEMDQDVTTPPLANQIIVSSGRLKRVQDGNGHALTFAYNGSRLEKIVGPNGREITLGYTDFVLSSVTDPRGNTTLLAYQDGALASVVGPEGCTLSYELNPLTNVLQRTDSKGYSYSYEFAGDVLTKVTDHEENFIQYSYGTVVEDAPPATHITLNRTTMTDTEGNVWEYRFDLAGNLWSVTNPAGHENRLAWDDKQLQFYHSEGFTYLSGDDDHDWVDNLNNRFERAVINDEGLVTAFTDSSGMVTSFSYDQDGNLTGIYPGRAHTNVGGLHWDSYFGSEGYLLCAFEENGDDKSHLPGYVSGVNYSGDTLRLSYDSSFNYRLGYAFSQIVMDPETMERQFGFWKADGGAIQFSVAVAELDAGALDKRFNLSIYTQDDPSSPGTHFGTSGSGQPFNYVVDFGLDLLITVSDLDGPRTFRVSNNAPGCWITFPVRGSLTTPISVSVEPHGDTELAVISAIAFDPFVNRETRYTYAAGRLTSLTDPLGNSINVDYNQDGQISSVTDGQLQTTYFYYEDVNKNLTRVVEPNQATTVYSYDQNSNLVKVQDALGRATYFGYDGRNRLVSVFDPLGNLTQLQYDGNGNLERLIDALGRKTDFLYDSGNRIISVTDPLDQIYSFGYDPSGRLTSYTDPKNHTTGFVYDDAGRVATIVQPDSETLTFGFDAMQRLVAVNPPNANQTDISAINLKGAKNLIRNYDAEEASLHQSFEPRYWDRPGNLGTWDSTEYYSGSRSLKARAAHTQGGVGVPYTWSQPYRNEDLLPGVLALTGGYARGSGEVDTRVSLRARVRDFFGDEVERPQSPVETQLSSANPVWVPLERARLSIPADAQYIKNGMTNFEVHKEPTDDTTNYWVDALFLQALGLAYRYDLEKRLREVVLPDGGRLKLERDLFGRVSAWTDPRGHKTSLYYDGLDRLVMVRDPEGNEVAYDYDEVGNLVSFVDARGKATAYSYDEVNRLTAITYPDTTTELFGYDLVGNLTSYTDNKNQTRSFTYDSGDRLTRVTYADQTSVTFVYDRVGNVVRRVERNGDALRFAYDKLDRLVSVRRIPAPGNATPAWHHRYTYDAVGNRTALKGEAPTSPALYGTARYGLSSYPQPEDLWSVPSDGHDEMDRLQKFDDRNSNRVEFDFDVDGRRTQIRYPHPAVDNVVTDATYDLLGRLLELRTTQGTQEIMQLNYGYDIASNRISMVSTVGGQSDAFDYGVDAAGRLIEEAINRFVECRRPHFERGELAHADIVQDGVEMLAFSDSFEGDEFNADRWQLLYRDYEAYPNHGHQIKQDDGLFMAFPVLYVNGMHLKMPPVHDRIITSSTWCAAQHRRVLSGDFDIGVDYENFQNAYHTDASSFEFTVRNSPLVNDAEATRYAELNLKYDGDVLGYIKSSAISSNTISGDNSGKLRIVRTGATLELYAWDNTGSSWQLVVSRTDFPTDDLYLNLRLHVNGTNYLAVKLTNFDLQTGLEYPTTASYTSAVYDAGRAVDWGSIRWSETKPTNTDVEFQVAVSSNPDGPWTFVGPDGTGSTRFTDPTGEDLLDDQNPQQPLNGRYMRYKAYLSSDGSDTPSFTDVQLSYGGQNTSTLQLYGFDASGNMTEKRFITDTTEVVETRTYNDLNQITENEIDDGTTVTTWTYTHDANGNMTGKSDGTDTWTYTWDEDNRLVRVDKNSVTQVEYEYDGLGRMIRRAVGANVAEFVWSGWTLLREAESGGVSSRFYAPEGFSFSMERNGQAYQLCLDALGSIMAVSDDTGSVQGNFSFDSWGKELSSSTSQVSGGMEYRFLGGIGIKHDQASGLVYMRNRWYDSDLGRFVSPDPISADLDYTYANNNPVAFTDPLGLWPSWWSWDAAKWALGEALLFAAAGVVAGAVAAYTLPLWAAFGFAALAGTIGAIGLAQGLYESASGWHLDGSGRLTGKERTECVVATGVSVATVILPRTAWARRGQDNDISDFWSKGPIQRIRNDFGKLGLRESVFKKLEEFPAESRPFWQIIFGWHPLKRGVWAQGASPPLRHVMPYGQAGSTVAIPEENRRWVELEISNF